MQKTMRAFRDQPMRYPGLLITVVVAIVGAIGALSQHFSLSDGLGAAFLIACFTAIFILFPVWILALIMSWFYKRSGISYDRGRPWLWTVPGIFAVLMALYVGVVGEQIQLDTAKGNGDDMGGIVFFFLYLYLGFFMILAALVLSSIRLFVLQRREKQS